MSKIILNKKLPFYFILYLIIFLLLPFILFKPQFLVRDIAWFIDYFIFGFPLTFIVFLLIIKKLSKNFINYRKVLPWLWSIFIVIYLLIIFYSYNMILGSFKDFKLF
ncbi:MAG: hypothetical protein WC582_03090 [Patescibacteria group bacterium]|jgi:hypothetical protein